MQSHQCPLSTRAATRGEVAIEAVHGATKKVAHRFEGHSRDRLGGLDKDNGASLLQGGNKEGIFGRNVIHPGAVCDGRWQASYVDMILYADGKAVERPKGVASISEDGIL
jgi:hypothetical protein